MSHAYGAPADTKEMTELLADCTSSEKEAILKIVRELKNTMHSQKKDN